jgi:hypothetical protein
MSRASAASRVIRQKPIETRTIQFGRQPEEHVTMSNISLAALLAVAAIGCSDADDDTIGQGQPSGFCPAEEAVCTGDTICGDDGCEQAFDRDYRVRLSLHRLGKGFCPAQDECPPPPPPPNSYVAVYFNEQAVPIIESSDPQVAQIRIRKGNSIGVDFGESDCALELTADRLRGGGVACSRTGLSAYLSLAAMPL